MIDKSRKIFFLIFTVLLGNLCGSSCFAQIPRTPFSFNHLLDDKGTLSNYINCFLEDKDGFLWVGTTDGLKRFDGNDFTIFKHEKGNINSLVQSEVLTLCEDNQGRIWVGTGEGICYFDKKTNQFVSLKELNKANNVCFNIVCDAQGDIWFSIRDRGLFHYTEKTKKLENFTHNPSEISSINNNRVLTRGMVLDPLKRGLWITTRSGLNFFEFASHQFYSSKNNPKNFSILNSKDVSTVALDGKNVIVFDAESYKINYFDVEKEKITKEIIVKVNFGKEDADIAYIFVDKQHNLWFSAWNHTAFFYDNQAEKLFQFVHDPAKPNSVAAPFFWTAFEQNDGAIWLGTSNGISITNPKNVFYEMYDLAQLYPSLKEENQLYLFTEDSSDNSWWLATSRNHFLHYFSKTNKLEIFSIPPNRTNPAPLIKALIEHKNDIFVVTTKSLHLFDKKQKKLNNLPLPNRLINKSVISYAKKMGDSIWVFSTNAKAYSYKISTKKWTYFPVLANTNIGINFLEVDNNGDIWITIHSTGLAKFSKEKKAFEIVKISNGIDFKKVGYSGMSKDKEGNFWIGSYDLIKFNPKTKAFTTALDINIIHNLIVDKEGKIWTTAYNDYTIFSPKTNETIRQTIPIDKGNLKWYNYLYSLRNGQLISLMKGDIVEIDPTKIIPAFTKSKVLISKITLVNDEILLHNDASFVSLTSSENGFGVYFSTLNPPFEHKYKFSYQLLGYNKKWVSTVNNSASFANLDGGDYVFKVKGIDNNGHETTVSTLNIHIDTLFYKSKWFLYGCILAICALIYAFVKFRANQRSKIYHLQMQSTRLEKDKTEIQYQNLINHLNPHFLFNSLTSLNSLIMTEPRQASKFLQKLSLIYRYILQNKEKDVVSLEQELGFVKHYIDLQKSRFEEGLQINIDIESDYLTNGIVPVTLQNLFENAIKHNTIEEDNPLIISVLIENDYLLVKNNLQRKKFVETSNKQGLDSLKNLYKYLTSKPLETIETDDAFLVKIPLL